MEGQRRVFCRGDLIEMRNTRKKSLTRCHTCCCDLYTAWKEAEIENGVVIALILNLTPIRSKVVVAVHGYVLRFG